MKSNGQNDQLMKAGEEAFWEEFENGEQGEERYVIVDTSNKEIVAENVRLVKEKKKIEV